MNPENMQLRHTSHTWIFQVPYSSSPFIRAPSLTSPNLQSFQIKIHMHPDTKNLPKDWVLLGPMLPSIAPDSFLDNVQPYTQQKFTAPETEANRINLCLCLAEWEDCSFSVVKCTSPTERKGIQCTGIILKVKKSELCLRFPGIPESAVSLFWTSIPNPSSCKQTTEKDTSSDLYLKSRVSPLCLSPAIIVGLL